jgi:excisionase family DNA binding protein
MSSPGAESPEFTNLAWWTSHPAELQEARRLAEAAGPSAGGAGAIESAPAAARLTLTVEEAAEALGISRASAYEAVRVKQIPSVRIGKRILVPKAALEKMLEAAAANDDPGRA